MFGVASCISVIFFTMIGNSLIFVDQVVLHGTIISVRR